MSSRASYIYVGGYWLVCRNRYYQFTRNFALNLIDKLAALA
jgi:hypothetical protein